MRWGRGSSWAIPDRPAAGPWPMTTVKLGALCRNQNTDWTSLLEAGIHADRPGYDTLWAWDR